ncbi:hypothetical protein HanRHA438_Chr10g0442851 [Helianthus annuus]|nr:hypothetical protein HanRHA438_Chr10g0442851 [Helianthus annuus]
MRLSSAISILMFNKDRGFVNVEEIRERGSLERERECRISSILISTGVTNSNLKNMSELNTLTVPEYFDGTCADAELHQSDIETVVGPDEEYEPHQDKNQSIYYRLSQSID